MPEIPAWSIALSPHSKFFPGPLLVGGGGGVEGNISVLHNCLPVFQPVSNGLVNVTPTWHSYRRIYLILIRVDILNIWNGRELPSGNFLFSIPITVSRSCFSCHTDNEKTTTLKETSRKLQKAKQSKRQRKKKSLNRLSSYFH